MSIIMIAQDAYTFQGLYRLMEDSVLIQAREKDYGLVESAVQEAAAEFKSQIGKDVQVTIDKEHPLPAER